MTAQIDVTVALDAWRSAIADVEGVEMQYQVVVIDLVGNEQEVCCIGHAVSPVSTCVDCMEIWT